MSFKNFFYGFFKSYFHKKIYMQGLSHILNIREKYEHISNLQDVDYKIFSQNGEDGIIDYLLNKIKIEKPKFVEVGVGNYLESNTRFIFERTSASGLIIDCMNGLEKEVKNNLKVWKGELFIHEEMIESKSLNNILSKYNFSENTDLFSLDIDGLDYWVIKNLPKNFSKIVVLEYNSVFGDKLEVTIPEIKMFDRKKYHHSHLCYGSSLKAIISLMKNKNFYFVGSNLLRNNAFFVSNDFPKEKYFPNLKVYDLEYHTNCNVSESRDEKGKLNFLKGSDKLKSILDCEVVDVSDTSYKQNKLRYFIEKLD
tara:strand:+ start:2417 stop:3346 length:930 start_codon:yes stop_codon:yes gene_type:complete